MNYGNILGLGLVTMTFLATSPMSFAAAAPNPRTPLRMAKATVQILRVEVSYDAATGKGDHKRTPVCTQNIDLAVSDSRNNVVRPGYVQCSDKVNGQDIKIITSAMFALQRGSLIEGTPETDFKYLAIYSNSQYVNNFPGSQLPDIPANMSYSKDLNQKFFGAFSAPKQFVLCQAESVPSLPQDPDPNEPAPKPRPQSSNCTVQNPLGYQVVWEVEDTI